MLLLFPLGNRARRKNVTGSLAQPGRVSSCDVSPGIAASARCTRSRPQPRQREGSQDGAPGTRFMFDPSKSRGRNAKRSQGRPREPPSPTAHHGTAPARGGSQPPAPSPAPCPKFIGSGSERSSFVSQCPSQTDQNCIFTEAIKIPGIHRPYDLLNMFLIAKLPIDEKISPVGYCLAWGYRTGGIFPALLGTFKAGEPGRSGVN